MEGFDFLIGRVGRGFFVYWRSEERAIFFFLLERVRQGGFFFAWCGEEDHKRMVYLSEDIFRGDRKMA